MAKANAKIVETAQVFCSNCNAPVLDCRQCEKLFTCGEAIYCDDGQHVHVECWEDYKKANL